MEEFNFASFTPITSFDGSNPEQLLDYYAQNNINTDNPYIKDYLELIKSEPSKTKNSIESKKLDLSSIIKPLPYKEIKEATNESIKYDSNPPKNKKEFLERYNTIAEEASKKSGIPKKFLLAQVALETGWGKHTHGYNIGGIKAFDNWKGKKQFLQTQESENGKLVSKPQPFRVYDSPEEGFNDYISLLMNNPRYKGLKGVTDFKAVEIIGKSGYATDPSYSSKLKQIMSQIN